MVRLVGRNNKRILASRLSDILSFRLKYYIIFISIFYFFLVDEYKKIKNCVLNLHKIGYNYIINIIAKRKGEKNETAQ